MLCCIGFLSLPAAVEGATLGSVRALPDEEVAVRFEGRDALGGPLRAASGLLVLDATLIAFDRRVPAVGGTRRVALSSAVVKESTGFSGNPLRPVSAAAVELLDPGTFAMPGVLIRRLRLETPLPLAQGERFLLSYSGGAMAELR